MEQLLGKIKLLLVEDDEDFACALRLRLEKKGFEVISASSAESALDTLKSGSFEVVVTDIKLPGMDGMGFLTKVREFKSTLPVIIITGYASLETAKEAVKLNASDYILKPLENISDLLDPIYKATCIYRLSMDNKKLTDTLRANVLKLEVSENALKESETKLREQNTALKEKNVALKEVIEQIEIEKKQIKDEVFANVDKLLLPTLARMKKKATSFEVKCIEMLEKDLEQLTSSFGKNISDNSRKLTPREIEVCKLIKNGLSNKDISSILGVSQQTTEKHRSHIRKKLELSNRNVNLSTYMQTF